MFCMCGGLWYASNFFSFTEEDIAMPRKAKKRRIARARRFLREHAYSLPREDTRGRSMSPATKDRYGREAVQLVVAMQMSAAKQLWVMGLLKQHPGANPLFKKGRNFPYITLDSGPVFDKHVTEGFREEVMVPLPKHGQVTIIMESLSRRHV